ncbi:hypothetical protein B0H14DRAFT_2573166 [Mycena olivaceomarginata]|nr:hypothetical protein B0H14DRAFT_2573166 [Mycena olivaceomarginata]
MSSDSPPFLPPELEREIFENTATLHRDTIPNLLLVSHRVCEWIGRIKYRTVACARFLLSMIRSNSKPPSFFRDRVETLIVQNLEDDELEDILSVCTRAHSLTIIQHIGKVPSLDSSRPRRLSLYLRHADIASPHILTAMFTFVTHLKLFDLKPRWQAETTAHLALLPVLTHLALWAAEMLIAALARCGGLRALIYINRCRGLDPPPLDDARLVSLLGYERWDEWEVGMPRRFKLDFWARADAFIAKKRRGEIKPSSSSPVCLAPLVLIFTPRSPRFALVD